MRLLAIPRNEASRGFPFPLLPRVARLKEDLNYCPPNHVDNWSVAHVRIWVRDGHHTGACQFVMWSLGPVRPKNGSTTEPEMAFSLV